MTVGHIIEPGNSEPIPVPSGQLVTLLDVIRDEIGPQGRVLRFRFLASDISRTDGQMSYEAAASDIYHLCQTYALPKRTAFGPEPDQIIVSMSDRPVPFGQITPEATQFFEAFTVADGACIWENF